MAERPDCSDTVLANRVGNASASAQWRQLHNHSNDTEKCLQRHVDHIDKRLRALADLYQGNTEQKCDQNDLQHCAGSESADNGLRNDIQKEINDAAMFGCTLLIACNR